MDLLAGQLAIVSVSLLVFAGETRRGETFPRT